jgi:hypothetical protein
MIYWGGFRTVVTVLQKIDNRYTKSGTSWYIQIKNSVKTRLKGEFLISRLDAS